LGLSLGKTIGDGNCLFRTISDQLHSDAGGAHLEVRARVTAYMRDNADTFVTFFEGEDDATRRAAFSRHVAETAVAGGQAGQHEIAAASMAYERSIVVHQADAAFIVTR